MMLKARTAHCTVCILHYEADELSGSIVTQSRLCFGVDEHDDHDLTSRAQDFFDREPWLTRS